MKKNSDWKLDIESIQEIGTFGWHIEIHSEDYDSTTPMIDVWGNTAEETLKRGKLVSHVDELYNTLNFLVNATTQEDLKIATADAKKLLKELR